MPCPLIARPRAARRHWDACPCARCCGLLSFWAGGGGAHVERVGPARLHAKAPRAAVRGLRSYRGLLARGRRRACAGLAGDAARGTRAGAGRLKRRHRPHGLELRLWRGLLALGRHGLPALPRPAGFSPPRRRRRDAHPVASGRDHQVEHEQPHARALPLVQLLRPHGARPAAVPLVRPALGRRRAGQKARACDDRGLGTRWGALHACPHQRSPPAVLHLRDAHPGHRGHLLLRPRLLRVLRLQCPVLPRLLLRLVAIEQKLPAQPRGACGRGGRGRAALLRRLRAPDAAGVFPQLLARLRHPRHGGAGTLP